MRTGHVLEGTSSSLNSGSEKLEWKRDNLRNTEGSLCSSLFPFVFQKSLFFPSFGQRKRMLAGFRTFQNVVPWHIEYFKLKIRETTGTGWALWPPPFSPEAHCRTHLWEVPSLYLEERSALLSKDGGNPNEQTLLISPSFLPLPHAPLAYYFFSLLSPLR